MEILHIIRACQCISCIYYHHHPHHPYIHPLSFSLPLACLLVCVLPLSSDWQQEVVVSATVVGAFLSSLASGPMCDSLGRRMMVLLAG